MFINALTDILGSYSTVAPSSTFTGQSSSEHPTDLAGFVGKRLVASQEVGTDAGWNEARVKALTSDEQVSARFMYGDFFQYTPMFKLLFAGNHKPQLKNVDNAIKRRMHIIPFTFMPAVVDPDLPAKLKEEWPGILAWAMRGVADFVELRLQKPEVVSEATEQYLSGSDPFMQWMDACLEQNDAESAGTKPAFESWKSWAQQNQLRGTGPSFTDQREFNARIAQEFTLGRSGKTIFGVRLVTDFDNLGAAMS